MLFGQEHFNAGLSWIIAGWICCSCLTPQGLDCFVLEPACPQTNPSSSIYPFLQQCNCTSSVSLLFALGLDSQASSATTHSGACSKSCATAPCLHQSCAAGIAWAWHGGWPVPGGVLWPACSIAVVVLYGMGPSFYLGFVFTQTPTLYFPSGCAFGVCVGAKYLRVLLHIAQLGSAAPVSYNTCFRLFLLKVCVWTHPIRHSIKFQDVPDGADATSLVPNLLAHTGTRQMGACTAGSYWLGSVWCTTRGCKSTCSRFQRVCVTGCVLGPDSTRSLCKSRCLRMDCSEVHAPFLASTNIILHHCG